MLKKSKHFSDNTSDDQSWLKKIENQIEEENQKRESETIWGKIKGGPQDIKDKVFNLTSEQLLELDKQKGLIQVSEELMKNLTAEKKTIDDIQPTTTELVEDLTEIKPENKLWILQSLGFKQVCKFNDDMEHPNIVVSKAEWTHPFFESNATIKFDINTDDIKMIVNKIHNVGWRDAKHDIW